MALDVAQTAALLLPPLASHLVVEILTDLSIEFVDVHGLDAALEPIVFGPEPLNCRAVLPTLVGLARVKRLPHPRQYFVVEAQPAQQFRELPLQHLLSHILTPAGGRVTLAFIGVASAMVIDVVLLLDLADHRAPAFGASDQAGKREAVRHPAVFLGVSAVEHVLRPLPQLDRDQGLVPTLDQLAVPLEPARVETVAQNRMHGAHWHIAAAFSIE